MKKHNLIMSARLIIVVLLASFNVMVFAQFGGGQGTPEDPWQIANEDHLRLVFEHILDPEDHFIQTADIELENWWEYGTTFFYGTYDGNNYQITNLQVQGGNNGYHVGLIAQNQ